MTKPRYLLPCLLALTFSARAQWAFQPIGFANAAPTVQLNIDALDANTAWLISRAFITYTPSQVARTTNGGTSWAVGNPPLLTANQEEITSLSAVSGTTAWITTFVPTAGGGVPTGGRLLRTTDGGTSWTIQSSSTVFGSPASYPELVRFVSATEGVALGEQTTAGAGFETYTTTNAGQTWTRVPTMPALLPSEVIVPQSVAVLGTTLWFATEAGRVFKSVDKGQTWTVAQAPGASAASSGVGTVAFRDPQNGLFSILDDVATAHQLYATTDGGATWTRVTYTGPLHGAGLSAVPGTGNYVSTGVNFNNGDTGSSYSRDNGRTWVSIENQLDHTDVKFVSATVGWSPRFTLMAPYGVDKFTSLVLGSRADVALQAGLQLYPNPALDGLSSLGAARPLAGPAQVRVFDATGRLLSQQSWDGTTPLPLDLRPAAAGLYVLEVETATGVARQKLVR